MRENGMGDIGMIKGGCLPGSSAEKEEVLSSTWSITAASATVSGSTEGEEGEETVNTKQTDASLSMT